MAKIILFWTLIVLTVSLGLGGGAWLFFWIMRKLKSEKPFDF